MFICSSSPLFLHMAKNDKKTGKEDASENTNKRRPDYISDGIAIWVNMNKKGKPFLLIKIVGHNLMFARENPNCNNGGK